VRRTLVATEALVLLVVATVTRRVLPLRWIDGVLGARSDPSTPCPESADAGVADDVRWAIGAAARRLPWQPSCVPEALAASLMLRRRRVAYRVTVGVDHADGLAAHAWTEAGSVVVTGGRVRDRFAALSSYDHRVAS
jgi:hypothetical protein